MNRHIHRTRRSRLLALLVALAAASLLVVVAAAAADGTSRATVRTHSSSLGRILVDAQGRTLYLFERDKGRRSACYGQCAKFWPPLLTTGKPAAVAGARASLLGTTRRSNGTKQVTYAGHPLYRFAEDMKPGQTKGEGLTFFGGGWDVLSPAGKKIEKD
jgi:predicted lipoprotein with Yx(FWY)xxD motif